MKETEARTKYCPMAMSENRMCQGDDCMAWEKHYVEIERKEIDLSEEIPEGWSPIGRSSFAGRITIARYDTESEGDCGMKPKEHGCGYPG